MDKSEIEVLHHTDSTLAQGNQSYISIIHILCEVYLKDHIDI
jgi:hypothetical protein